MENEKEIKLYTLKIVKEAFKDFANSQEFKMIFKEAVEIGVKKRLLNNEKSDWIKGDKKASAILGINLSALIQRRNKGIYLEGVDWKKANSKLKRGTILWNKNALLKEID